MNNNKRHSLYNDSKIHISSTYSYLRPAQNHLDALTTLKVTVTLVQLKQARPAYDNTLSNMTTDITQKHRI